MGKRGKADYNRGRVALFSLTICGIFIFLALEEGVGRPAPLVYKRISGDLNLFRTCCTTRNFKRYCWMRHFPGSGFTGREFLRWEGISILRFNWMA